MEEVVSPYGIGTALVLGLWAYIAIVVMLAPNISFHEPIVAGAVTGMIVGNVPLGLAVGGTLMIVSLGMHTYGGATIPDFLTGAILGTAFGALAYDGNVESAMATGLTIAVPAALLMTQLDVFGRAITTVFIHGADKYVEDENFRGVTLMHLLGQLPWGLTRGIPVFLAIWLGAGPVQRFMEWIPEWFQDAISTTGAVLPALGFALLLSMLPVKKYWPFLVIGFILFAYLEVPVIGLAIAGAALAALYSHMKEGEASA